MSHRACRCSGRTLGALSSTNDEDLAKRLMRSIAALESQREILGDIETDTAIGVLRGRLDMLSRMTRRPLEELVSAEPRIKISIAGSELSLLHEALPKLAQRYSYQAGQRWYAVALTASELKQILVGLDTMLSGTHFRDTTRQAVIGELAIMLEDKLDQLEHQLEH
jgi:hypothetical protein